MTNDQLILDLSYYMHYLMHSAFNSIKDEFPFPTDKYELYKIDLTQHDEFLEKYKEKFFGTFINLKKNYSCQDCRVIVALDCSKKDIWRRDIYPDYKLPRMVPKEEGINKGPVFQWSKENLYPILEQQYNCILLKYDRAEGDDIVAVSKTILRKLNKDMNIYIIANDGDFLQLIDDNCFICTLDGKLLNENTMGYDKDVLYKVLFGDVSDNISKVFDKVKGDEVLNRGFGPVACGKLVESPELLQEKLQMFPDSVAKMELNRKLIEFKNIPKDIKEGIATLFLSKFR